MKVLGNIIWIIFGGWLSALLWLFFGGIMCITVIGIPVGLQCFKFSKLAFLPFGKEIVYEDKSSGKKAGNFVLNVIWLLFGGFWLAISFAVLGLIYCVTIIGIPFGKQYFKLAKLSFSPFGAKIVKA